jgi:hypothetical protein
MVKNDIQQKWSRLFASERAVKQTEFVKLNPLEQQELIDDIGKFTNLALFNDEFIDKIRHSLTNAEARRIILDKLLRV